MVKIKQQSSFRSLKYLLYCILVISFVPLILAQEPQAKKTVRKRIEVIADEDIKFTDKSGEEVHHLYGNVRFKHNEVLMYCDSAHYLSQKQQLTGFNNVHIEQGDTLDLYGNYIFYDGVTETALV